MRLEDAIARLDAIHVQVLRSETFRGVRALPTALTGGIALTAGLVQASCLVAADPAEFTSYWLTVAAIAATSRSTSCAVARSPSAARQSCFGRCCRPSAWPPC
jgi:hypothetical protein